MGPNFILFPLVAIIPMLVGFVWYHPKVFGTAWMAETGMTEEKAQQGNMAMTFGSAYVFAIMICIPVMALAVHQFGVFSLFAAEEGFGTVGNEATTQYDAIIKMIGDKHMTFGHGVVHGIIGGLFFVLPVLGTNALFEQKSWKYIWINVGYWIVCLALMGGVISQYCFSVTAG